MTCYKPNKLLKSLKSKGFREVDKDHKYLWLFVGNRQTSIRTKISHSARKEYDDSLLAQMRKQVKLETKDEFIDLIECPLTKEGYVDTLRQRRILAF